MRLAVAGLLVAVLAGPAGANGRDPFISTINFKAGDDSKIMAGATFGAVRSDDGGATWHWYCERAVGYGGTYDPDYVYTPSGAVFATTFDGLKVMRDGCTFAATPPGMTFVTHVERAPNGNLFFTASDPNDTKVYKSSDDGVTWPTSVQPSTADAWWQSIMVAPSDSQVVYLTGYRLPMKCTSNSTNPGQTCTQSTDCPSPMDAGSCEAQKEFLLFKSVNGGTSFTAMSMTGISPTSQNSAIDVVGIDPTDAAKVYIRVSLESTTTGDSIYRSINGGSTWTKILTRSSNLGGLSFLVRSDHTCVAGTRDIGAWKSTTCDSEGSFTALATAPHIGCLFESPMTHEVWACTQNTASVQLGISADGFGIMKSADLSTWTGVLRFEDIKDPVACGDGTVQKDRCVNRYMGEQSAWCCLVPQLGITSTAVDCTGYMACFGVGPEGANDGVVVKPPEKGCCDAGASPTSPVLLSLLVGILIAVRRRRPTSSPT